MTRGQASVRHDPSDNTASDEVVDRFNPSGRGPFVLVCEHASNHVPDDLNGLGLPDEVLQSHIAWDPGALPVARAMANMLDAPLISPRISRLVYDCNRTIEAEGAVPAKSEVYDIPGNAGLSDAQRRQRADRFYMPFHDVIAAEIDGKSAAGQSPVLVTVHTFVPVYDGVSRDLDIGVLHDADSRFADKLLAQFEDDSGMTVRRNAPYSAEDGVTHTLRTHALPRGLLNVMIEIRSDLVTDAADQRLMAERLARALRDALPRVDG